MEDIKNLNPIKITSSLFYFLEKSCEEISLLNNKNVFWKKCFYFFSMQYRQKKINHRKKIQKYITNVSVRLELLENLWKNSRSTGILDPKKVQANETLVKEIKKENPTELATSIIAWRLLTLSFIGDRLQPAYLIVPYIKENVKILEELHLYIHSLIQKLHFYKTHLQEQQEIIYRFSYRIRGLCIAIEENAPNNRSFHFLYMSGE